MSENTTRRHGWSTAWTIVSDGNVADEQPALSRFANAPPGERDAVLRARWKPIH